MIVHLAHEMGSLIRSPKVKTVEQLGRLKMIELNVVRLPILWSLGAGRDGSLLGKSVCLWATRG